MVGSQATASISMASNDSRHNLARHLILLYSWILLIQYKKNGYLQTRTLGHLIFIRLVQSHPAGVPVTNVVFQLWHIVSSALAGCHTSPATPYPNRYRTSSSFSSLSTFVAVLVLAHPSHQNSNDSQAKRKQGKRTHQQGDC